MTFTGHVREGVVVFDGSVRPPDGAIVRVEEVFELKDLPVGEALDRLAGQAKGLPSDIAEKHDIYRRERRAK